MYPEPLVVPLLGFRTQPERYLFSAVASGTWRRGAELNRCIRVLQTLALPLGYRAAYVNYLLRFAFGAPDPLHDTIYSHDVTPEITMVAIAIIDYDRGRRRRFR